MRLDRGEGDPARVVDEHPARHEHERGAHRPPGHTAVEHDEQTGDGPDQHHHQSAEHVQLRVQVDDHVAGLAAAVEQLVHRRKRLHRALQRPDGEGRRAGEHEPARRRTSAAIGADEQRKQQPERREHRDPARHGQPRVKRRRLLRLLRRQTAPDYQAPLVEAEIEAGAVERERAGEQEPEARVRRPA